MNSATNPRKFAEKIAKLHQKEQEQTQAFEQIMAEVIVATRVRPVLSDPPVAHLTVPLIVPATCPRFSSRSLLPSGCSDGVPFPAHILIPIPDLVT